MGRPATPTKVHELNGAYKAHPERKNHDEPDIEELDSTPPKYFNDLQCKYFYDLIDRSLKGVGGKSDYYLFTTGAVLLAEMEDLEGKLPTPRIGQLISVLAKLGMTPSDRAGLKVPKNNKSKFDGI